MSTLILCSLHILFAMFNCRACAGFSAHWMYTQAYFISRLNELTAYEMGSALMDMPAMAFILISLIAGSCAQFAPDGAQVHRVQDIHFPEGNEHSASVGDTVTFHIELGNINMNPVVPWLCKDNKCIGLYYTPVAVGSTTTILIRATIHIKSDEFFGTWGLHFAGNARFAAESPLLALIYIHDVKRVETHMRTAFFGAMTLKHSTMLNWTDPLNVQHPKTRQLSRSLVR